MPSDERKAQSARRKTRDATPTLSVLVPARNEPFLARTVQDLQAHMTSDYEILIGRDGADDLSELPADDPRVRIVTSDERIGMRPILNMLLAEAKGRYILKCDGHVSIAPGADQAMIDAWRPGAAVTCRRYDLATDAWQKREHSKTDVRRLTHVSEDGIGLRSMAWPEYEAAQGDKPVIETMTCSGSLWLIERDLWSYWGGWDTTHGHFGQEGAELACKVWLSGGKLLHVCDTWYAHWNRGKATYSMGAKVKPTSIARSHELWVGDNWPYQKYAFAWLIEKFQPPGWPAVDPPEELPTNRMGGPCKAFKKGHRIADLWDHRDGIAEPPKRHRLAIFYKVFESFVRSVLAGTPDFDGPYKHYRIGHLKRSGQIIPTDKQLRHVHKKMMDSVRLIESIRAKGLLAPLEFYRDLEGKRMILWKGYRRLVIAHVLGIKSVALRSLYDLHTAKTLSPQNNMIHLKYPPSDRGRRIAEKHFAQWGWSCTDKYYVHDYVQWYDRYFAEMGGRCKRLLELGLARGASLAFWRDYFPKAELIGGEIDPKRWKQFAGNLPRTRVLIGDETDPAYLAKLAAAGPYDIIIDDADHHPEKQAAAFDALWPSVRPHGYYVIEDIYRTFADNGQGRCLPTDMESRLYREHKIGVAAGDIAEIHWHTNIVFVRKAGV